MSVPTPAPVATFELNGVPPSPNRSRWAREDAELLTWKTAATYAARGAANKAHWEKPPPPVTPPVKRFVNFTLYRHRLIDSDHVYTSVTPLFNGLKGVLIVDDSPDWAELHVHQVQIELAARERTVCRVALVAAIYAPDEIQPPFPDDRPR